MNIQTAIVSTDEPFVEAGLRAFFAEDSGFELLTVARTPAELFAAALQFQPTVIVCGLSTEADLSSIREVIRNAPDSSIVLWARGLSTERAHQAVGLGVRGFLSTRSSAEQFKECLEVAARGELWMEKSLTMSLLGSRPVSLSRRQSQLVSLLVQGLKNKEIAGALGISEGTVKAYLTTLYEKVGARDRFELALFGLKNLGLKNLGEARIDETHTGTRGIARNNIANDYDTAAAPNAAVGSGGAPKTAPNTIEDTADKSVHKPASERAYHRAGGIRASDIQPLRSMVARAPFDKREIA